MNSALWECCTRYSWTVSPALVPEHITNCFSVYRELSILHQVVVLTVPLACQVGVRVLHSFVLLTWISFQVIFLSCETDSVCMCCYISTNDMITSLPDCLLRPDVNNIKIDVTKIRNLLKYLPSIEEEMKPVVCRTDQRWTFCFSFSDKNFNIACQLQLYLTSGNHVHVFSLHSTDEKLWLIIILPSLRWRITA